MPAIDQILVDYKANMDPLQAQLTQAEAAFRKTDQAATQSANKISGAFQKTGGIVENLNAHLRSLEQRRDKAMNPAIIQTFNKRIDETRAKIQALTGQVDKSGQSMVMTFRNIAASVGIAFGAQQVISFGKELINVALGAEEVKTAFAALNQPELLTSLRDAVSGTVDDVTLMSQALKAANLEIPINELATAFEFAERRAGALGLSTEQMIESIVQGIGSKSTRAFTAMGISSLRVQDALKGMNAETAEAGDIARAMGEIFREELGKMGPAIDSNSDKVERLQAQWKNLKVEMGTGLVSVLLGARDAFNDLRDGISGVADDLLGNFGQSILNIADPFNIFHRSVEDSTESLLENAKAGKLTAAEVSNLEIEIAELNEKLLSPAADIFGKSIKEQVKNLEAIRDAARSAKTAVEEISIPQVDVFADPKDKIKSIKSITDEIERLEKIRIITQSKTVDNQVKQQLTALRNELAIRTGEQTEAMKKEAAEVEKNRQEYEKWLEVQKEITKERERQELILDPKESIIPVTNALDEMTQGVNDLLSGLKTLAEEGGLDATLIENRIAITDIISSIDQLEGELSILSSVGDAFGSLYQVLSKDSADFANFQKALALFQIAIDSAQAVSAAVRVAVTSSTNPLQAAVQIAATIALVLANIAKAKQLIEGAQVPAFAEGDINIKGPGTKKSDSIPARLSRGESVITADGTTLDPDLLRAMNKGESEFLKHIQVNYVWPYMEQVIKAHSKAESKSGMTFNDRNILKRLDTGNKLQVKTTQALINALNKKEDRRKNWN